MVLGEWSMRYDAGGIFVVAIQCPCFVCRDAVSLFDVS